MVMYSRYMYFFITISQFGYFYMCSERDWREKWKGQPFSDLVLVDIIFKRLNKSSTDKSISYFYLSDYLR